MGIFSKSNKKLSNFKFFIIFLLISVVVAFAIAYLLQDEEIISIGLFVAFLASVFFTLFRILKNGNKPENWLGNWKYFLTLFFIITEIFFVGLLSINADGEIVSIALFFAFLISLISTMWRGIRHWRQGKKSEKERKQQYQERLQRENQQYANELEKKNRIIRGLENQNAELKKNQRSSRQSVYYSSDDDQWEREQEQKWEIEQESRKKQQLEDWYRDYVTIEVSFDYHIKDSEYNQDYWERRSEDIRVTRREAMALIEGGEGGDYRQIRL